MSNLRRILPLPAVSALALVIGACSGGGTIPPSASTEPSGSPGPSPTTNGMVVDHATGTTDVVLRMETGGGFVPIGFAATQAPSFSLYGDGTLIARDDAAPWPDPGPDGLMTLVPFFKTQLSEADVQALLAYALGEGGLGIARAKYDAGGVADAPSTWFTVRAGGLDKTVDIYALGIDAQDGADAQARRAFAALADRLRAIAADMPATTEPYLAERWRGVLLEAGMGGASAPVAWPWPDLNPADFTQAEPGGVQFANRVLSAAEVAALGIGDPGGGVQNIALLAPDGQTGYTLALRPLLPDEEG